MDVLHAGQRVQRARVLGAIDALDQGIWIILLDRELLDRELELGVSGDLDLDS